MEEEQRVWKTRPIVTAVLIVFNILVYIVLEILGDTTDSYFMYEHGANFPPAVLEDKEFYRLLTCTFLHFGMEHLLNNMVLLGCLGVRLEDYCGHFRFALVYLISGIGSSILSMEMMVRTGDMAVSAGASGAIFGLIGALIVIAIKNKGHVEGLTTKGLLFMLALSLYFGISTANVDNFGHVGGALSGALFALLFLRRKR
ncbi:MAG: rhomboid family intramembrane serine protease [Lachnospiraceae bacterium]